MKDHLFLECRGVSFPQEYLCIKKKKIKHTQMQKPTKPTNGDTKPPNGEPQLINGEKICNHLWRARTIVMRWNHWARTGWKRDIKTTKNTLISPQVSLLKSFWVLGVLIRVMLCFGVKRCFCNGWAWGGLRRLTETYHRWVKWYFSNHG